MLMTVIIRPAKSGWLNLCRAQSAERSFFRDGSSVDRLTDAKIKRTSPPLMTV